MSNLHAWIRRSAVSALLAIAVCTAFPSLAVAATDNATLTITRSTLFGQCPNLNFTSGPYSPAALTGGKTVDFVTELDCNSSFISLAVRISGFAIDPGQAWITSMTCNGVTKTGASAASFNYGSGKANWTWYSSFGLYSLPVSTNVSCSITHP